MEILMEESEPNWRMKSEIIQCLTHELYERVNAELDTRI